MFPQIVTTKKPDGSTYRYLHIVESYRVGAAVKKRRIASLGNIDAYSDKEIEQIIHKLESVLQNRVVGSLSDLNPVCMLEFGVPYVVQFLWDQLHLSEAIRAALGSRNVEFDVAEYIKAMVINRLADPASKRELFLTVEDFYLPDAPQNWKLQDFYRALDYLMDIKPKLEHHLYRELTNLLNFQLSLVFYDMTSTHVSGHCCPIAKHGYSRTHRPDLEQVELGLLVTPDGLPITHEVFSGEVPDKKTVAEVLKKLKHDYCVEKCVFVGDRGMVTGENFTLLEQADYPYIVGYHKRGRVVSDHLLESYQDLEAFAKIRDNLSYFEVPESDIDDDEGFTGCRYLLCYNPLKAEQDAAFRSAALQEAEDELQKIARLLTAKHRGRATNPKNIMIQVGKELTRKNVQSFFEINYDGSQMSYSRNEAALAKEALRDGKFIVKTNTTLASEDVILSYKNLMNVERAFREIKNFLDVGPLRHWNEKRVRGHIFICVLAYLFEQELQVMYRRHWQHQRDDAKAINDPQQRDLAMKQLERTWFTGEHLIKELRRWSVMKAEFLGKEFLSVPPPPGDAKHMLEAMGIPLPDKSILIT